MAIHRSFRQGQRRRPIGPDLGQCEGVVAERILGALYGAAAQLDRLGIRYAAIGGLAVGAHGAPRATKDVDFLVGEEAFEHHGPIVSFRAGLPIVFGDVAVDPVSIGVEEEFLNAAFNTAVVSHGVPVIALAPLIYMKLSAGRRQDIADVARLMESADARPVRAYLKLHAPELLPLLIQCMEREP